MATQSVTPTKTKLTVAPKPETPEAPQCRYPMCFVFRPNEVATLLASIVALIGMLPRGKAKEAATALHDLFLKSGCRQRVDDLAVSMATLDDVADISESLDSMVAAFFKMPEDSPERRFADILRPIQRWLQMTISSEFPGAGDLADYRGYLVEQGFEDHLHGNGRHVV